METHENFQTNAKSFNGYLLKKKTRGHTINQKVTIRIIEPKYMSGI